MLVESTLADKKDDQSDYVDQPESSTNGTAYVRICLALTIFKFWNLTKDKVLRLYVQYFIISSACHLKLLHCAIVSLNFLN
jgi:hypothetical protein